MVEFHQQLAHCLKLAMAHGAHVARQLVLVTFRSHYVCWWCSIKLKIVAV